ncbi:MAG: hypothetical protein R2741_03275 [Methanolobus sp.]
MAKFEVFVESTTDIEIPLIAGVIPLKSAKIARYHEPEHSGNPAYLMI